MLSVAILAMDNQRIFVLFLLFLAVNGNFGLDTKRLRDVVDGFEERTNADHCSVLTFDPVFSYEGKIPNILLIEKTCMLCVTYCIISLEPKHYTLDHSSSNIQ